MKKLLIGVCAAVAAAVAFGGRTVSFVSFDNDKVNLSFEGEGPTSSLVMGYGSSYGGVNPEGWEHVVGVGVVLSNQTEAAIALPPGWGETVKQAKFFLYDGIANRPSYVYDGLVACWDAYDNSAAGKHDQFNRTTWVDTVGGRVFSLTSVLSNDKFGMRVDGTLDEVSSGLLLDGGTNTVEAMLQTVDKTSSYLIKGTKASKVLLYDYYDHIYFSSPNSTGIPRADGGNTYAAVYDQATGLEIPQIKCCLNGVEARDDKKCYWSTGSTKIEILPNATFGALRFYNRELSEEELKLNAWIDRVRYVDRMATDNIVSSVRVTEGGVAVTVKTAATGGSVTGGGDYAYGATVTLTAVPEAQCTFSYWSGLPANVDATQPTVSFPADCDRDVRAFIKTSEEPIDPVGRSLTVMSVSRDEHDNPVSATVAFGADASRTDTLYVAYGSRDGGTDIGLWEHVEPVRVILPDETSYVFQLPNGWGQSVKALRFFFRDGVDANSYVKENLIAQWDGADNVATGTHDPSAKTWVDRVGGLVFNLENPVISDRAVGFAGNNTSYGVLESAAESRTFSLSCDRTIECAIDETGNAIVLASPSSIMIGPYGGSCYFKSSPTAKYTLYKLDMAQNPKCFSLLYGEDNVLSDVHINGEKPASSGTDCWFISPSTTYIGCGGVGKYHLSGCIYGLRVYEGALTELNRQINLTVDRLLVSGCVSSGRTVSCSDVLLSEGEIKSKYTVSAEVLCGTVTGTGEFEEGEVVTLAVTMDEGCTFVRWTGNVPSGVDASAPTITFVAREDVTLSAMVKTPWMTVKDESGVIIQIFNGDWRFNVTADDAGLTLSSRVSGSADTLDISHVRAETGLPIVAFGESVFSGASKPTKIVHAGDELKMVGASAFQDSKVEAFEPSAIASLETIADRAFERSSIKALFAPNLTSVGIAAFKSATALTNVIKEVFDFPLREDAFEKTSAMSGTVVIDSSVSEIPVDFLSDAKSLTNITVRSPVSKICDYALVSLGEEAEIVWEANAPAELGVRVLGRSKPPYTRLYAKKRLDGWRSLSDFVPIEQIPAEFKTEAYGWMPRAIGWIESSTYRCWVIDGRSQGLMLIIR